MLLSFSVGNFLSFRDTVELNLTANSADKELPGNLLEEEYFSQKPKMLPVVRAAALYGANASGKTNFLTALMAFKRLVTYLDQDNNARPKLPPFRLDPACLEKPCTFEVKILLDTVHYRYGFMATEELIVEEWLFIAEKGRERLAFTRLQPRLEEKAVYKFGSKESGLQVLAEKQEFVREDVLLLSVASKFNSPHAKKLVSFIAGIHLLDVKENLDKGGEHISLLKPLARFADFGIEDLEYNKISQEKISTLQNGIDNISNFLANPKLSKNKKATAEQMKALAEIGIEEDSYETVAQLATRFMAKTLEKFSEAKEFQFLYKNVKGELVSFPLDSQSRGTKVFLSLFSSVLDGYKENTVLLCDELEHSLHPMLLEAFLEIFYSIPNNKTQLIFTTHNTLLLNAKLFRRDQIWLTEKNRVGSTTLTGLDEFKGTRKGALLGKHYLEGRFGAIPVFNQRQKRDFLEQVAMHQKAREDR